MSAFNKAYPRLNPTNDIVFKKLFSENEPLLINLLTSVLRPASPIKIARVVNPALPTSAIDHKNTVLDIHVEFEDGSRVNVEMQSQYHEALYERLLYYWAKMYVSQLTAGASYSHLQPCLGIYFLGFLRQEDQQFHSIYEILEKSSGHRFSGALQLHTIQLPRLLSEQDTKLNDRDLELSQWARFFTTNDEKEIESLMADPHIREAEEKLEALSADPAVRYQAELREHDELAYNMVMCANRTKGREEGREEGRKQIQLLNLLHVLSTRFGEPSKGLKSRLDDASSPQLETWFKESLNAKSLSDIFGPPLD